MHGLAVIRYDDARSVDHFLAAQKRLGDTLLGVVVNNVPAMHMEFCETALREFLENQGIGVFAVLPLSTDSCRPPQSANWPTAWARRSCAG